jgi:hypothetical protein
MWMAVRGVEAILQINNAAESSCKTVDVWTDLGLLPQDWLYRSDCILALVESRSRAACGLLNQARRFIPAYQKANLGNIGSLAVLRTVLPRQDRPNIQVAALEDLNAT